MTELIERLMAKHVLSVEEEENESDIKEIELDFSFRRRPSSLQRVKDIKDNYVSLRE